MPQIKPLTNHAAGCISGPPLGTQALLRYNFSALGAVAQRKSKGLISPGSLVQFQPAPLNRQTIRAAPTGAVLLFTSKDL